MAIRYLNQRDGYSCGPIAIINVLKWLGHRATEDQLPYFRNLCSTSIKDGTSAEDISSALDWYDNFIQYDFMPTVTLGRIVAQLKRGIILLHYWINTDKEQDNGHYILIIGTTKKGFLVVNEFNKGYALRECTSEHLSKRINVKDSKGKKAFGWIIRKA